MIFEVFKLLQVEVWIKILIKLQLILYQTWKTSFNHWKTDRELRAEYAPQVSTKSVQSEKCGSAAPGFTKRPVVWFRETVITLNRRAHEAPQMYVWVIDVDHLTPSISLIFRHVYKWPPKVLNKVDRSAMNSGLGCRICFEVGDWESRISILLH